VPDEMSIILSNELSNVAAQTTLDLQGLIASMRTSGMSDSAIKATLMSDLTSGGRLFGNYRNGVKNTVKSGIGRAGNIASEGRFFSAGVNEFRWVTASSKPCPDCERRHGETGTMEYWRTAGKPRSGFSVCQSSCQCQLLPEGYNGENLDKPLVREKKKVSITSPKMAGKHKTVNDAQKWAEKNIAGKVNYSSLNIKQANTINNQLTKLSNKYPHIKIGDINLESLEGWMGRKITHETGAFRVESIFTVKSKYKNTTQYDRLILQQKGVEIYDKINDLYINPKFFEHYTDDLFDKMMKQQFSNHWSLEETFEDIIIHEFGHMLQKNPGVYIRRIEHGVLQDGWTQMLPEARVKAYNKYFVDSVSKYANTNGTELLAELFTKYYKGEKLGYLEKEFLEYNLGIDL
tara:strand:- start:179 stop:1390 length:1212 start_codon:yes stop_codon:yes gene_type:complete